MNHHETCGICHISGPCIHTTVPTITKEAIENIMKEAARHFNKSPAERAREDLERRKPKSRTGTCRVCGGVVTEEFTIAYEPFTIHTPIGGPPSPGWWTSTGLSCVDCGVMYSKSWKGAK